MQVDTFFKLSDEFLAECKDIQVEKGREYTVDSSDKFKNFKSIGDRLGMDAKTVALVYMLKHMDSIRAYILSGKEGSEGLKGRCQDLVNYAIMLYAMDYEEKEYIKLEKDIDANGEDLTYFNKLKKLHA